VLGRFRVKKLGAKTVAIIDDRTAYGQGLADEVEKARRKAARRSWRGEFTRTTLRLQGHSDQDQGRKPDAGWVLSAAMIAQAGPMAKQMKQLGIRPSSCRATAPARRSSSSWRDATDATMLPGRTASRPDGRQGLRRAVQEALQREVQIYSPYSYDAVAVLWMP